MKRRNDKESRGPANGRFSRRKFLKGAGVTGLGAVVAGTGMIGGMAGRLPAATGAEALGPGPVPLRLHVNGKWLSTTAEPRLTLAEVLRDKFHLTGTKIVCDRGACGACTVLVDGAAVCSCHLLALDARGHEIQTIEGIAEGDRLHPLQQAFIAHDALQCGFCTPGMIMSSKALLDRNPHPDPEEIRTALSGNLCRCGTYPNVIEAVLSSGSGQRKED